MRFAWHSFLIPCECAVERTRYSYARDKVDVTIREATLSDNFAATGSVIFVVDNSIVNSYQVTIE